MSDQGRALSSGCEALQRGEMSADYEGAGRFGRRAHADRMGKGARVLWGGPRFAQKGAEIVSVVTIVDREEGADAAFAAAGLTLTPLLTLTDFK